MKTMVAVVVGSMMTMFFFITFQLSTTIGRCC